MSVYEQLCVTKLLFISMGAIAPNAITSFERDVACEAIKRMADQRQDWTPQQREFYKWLVDYAKEFE